MDGNTARVTHTEQGRYMVQIGAADIGTGTWTALAQIAADALGCGVEAIDLQIGDSDLPQASVAGGSSGITSWGSAIVAAANQFRREHGDPPHVGVTAEAEAPQDLASYHFSAHADVTGIEAIWLDEVEEHLNPMGSRGAGEIGIVGAAAAVVNAVHHATGVRVRELPVTLDKVLPGLP